MQAYSIPTVEELQALIGAERNESWLALCGRIDSLYDMERSWGSGGKRWRHEYKYRRGGKTLCALYAREDCAGFMVIFGGEEQRRFEEAREQFSPEVCACYDASTVYRDGRWVMFPLEDEGLFEDYIRLLALKRRPNRKPQDNKENRQND